jgi:hypothetical protein
MKPHEHDFANLVNELLERVMDEELFTCVLLPHVDPTNNLAERLQRSPAQDRKAGRTSKTATGAHRSSVIAAVSSPQCHRRSVIAAVSSSACSNRCE